MSCFAALSSYELVLEFFLCVGVSRREAVILYGTSCALVVSGIRIESRLCWLDRILCSLASNFALFSSSSSRYLAVSWTLWLFQIACISSFSLIDSLIFHRMLSAFCPPPSLLRTKIDFSTSDAVKTASFGIVSLDSYALMIAVPSLLALAKVIFLTCCWAVLNSCSSCLTSCRSASGPYTVEHVMCACKVTRMREVTWRKQHDTDTGKPSEAFMIQTHSMKVLHTMSQRSRAGNPSIRNPASREMIWDSAEPCDTEVCFLHIQLTETNVLLPNKHIRFLPEVDFESSRPPAKSESWNKHSLQCCVVFSTWQYCRNSFVWWM